MNNSMRGNMGSLKSENSSCTMLQTTSPTESGNNSESKKTPSLSCDMETSSLTPPSLKFPSLKVLLENEDVEVQSPTTALLESFFSDQIDGDFMISSPVRVSSTQAPDYYNNNHYNHNMTHQMQTGQSSLGLSNFSNTNNTSSSQNKGKGLSPLSRFFNSPNNNQYMHHGDQNQAMTSIEDFLEDFQKAEFPDYSQCFDMPNMGLSGGFDCLSMETSIGSSRYCGSMSETSAPGGSSQITQDSGVNYHMRTISSSGSFSQLPQEPHQEKQHLHCHHNNMNNLMMPSMPAGSEQEQDSGLQLVHLLLACAEAVAKEDFMLARKYLHHLNRVVSPLGDSMQRVASCFTEALSTRLAATLTTRPSTSSPKPFSPFPPNSVEILKIYQILYQACPYIKFAHFTANQAIFEAIEFEERVHVIDLDILQGYQWPAFMQALAARPNGPPFLRITGVGPSLESVEETGRCLTELAHSLHIPFEFHPVGEQLEDIKPHMLNRRVGEALAVNSVNRLHHVPGNCIGNLLAMIRDQAPNIVTLVEQEASHNGPYFLGRFLEALHYYSAIFDSLDATFPPESAQRAKVEQYIFAPEIRNIVAFEGAERTERHERLEKWRKTMEGKGFRGVALSGNAVTQSKILLGLYSCDGYRLREDKGCLLLGWQDRAIIAASAWRC